MPFLFFHSFSFRYGKKFFLHYLFSKHFGGRKREKKHNCIYMCIKRHEKKIPTTKNCIHFSIFFPGPTQENRKERRKEAKEERGKKMGNKNNFMLMYLHGSHNKNYVYMWRLIQFMIHTISPPSHSLPPTLMVLCVIFPDILSFISDI